RVVATDLVASGIRVPVHGEVRAADLRDKGAADRLLQGCDYVLHTAAQLSLRADAAELGTVNTDAVVRLYEAAKSISAQRFVHISTATLYAVGQEGPLGEDSPVAPRGPHGLSKHGAEVYLRGQKGGPEWTILRPAPIYGQRGRHF